MTDLAASCEKLGKLFAKGINQKIVAFGDSNTTHYSTEPGIVVEDWESYAAMLNVLCSREPILYGSIIVKQGHPGWMAQNAYENAFHTEVIDQIPGFALISFGTNDIRNNVSLEAYIKTMCLMVMECLQKDILPFVLAIPWNESTAEAKLIQWNTSLFRLCEKHGIPFIDVYTLTRYEPDKYFMERGLALGNSKRHYNHRASMEIAALIVHRIKEVTMQQGFAPAYYQDMWSLEQLKVFKMKSFEPQTSHIQTHSIGSSIDVLGVPIQTSFQTVEIPMGQSVSLQAYGKICIGFYTEAEVSVNFSGDLTEEYTIVPSGLLLQRKAFGRESVLTDVTITPSGTCCKIRSIAAEGFIVKA